MLTGAGIHAGDLLLGLPSTGLHTNGYSLARKLLFESAGYGPKTFLPELGSTVGDELLKVHRSYLRPIQKLLAAGVLKGAAHITGGGMSDNLPRILPAGLAAEIDRAAWPVPPVFELLRRLGNVPEDDYRRTFNLGIGMVLAIAARSLSRARRILDGMKETHYQIGRVVAAKRGSRSRVLYL
jgi:phosphoribosylformylglycinamidine cyclo-ligase